VQAFAGPFICAALAEAAFGAYVCAMAEPLNAIDEAERAGFDMRLLDANLSYSYEQRVVHHQEALDLVLALEKAGYQVDERWVVRKLWELREKRPKS
jgi:hypothetical protein